MPVHRPVRSSVGLALAALVTAACGSDPAEPAAAPSAAGADGAPVVVASTDVWGDIARSIAGDAATVESIIDDPSADPHSYESTPQDAAEVAGADLVVFNGGGYDEFMEQIVESEGGADAVNAVEAFAVSGKDEGTNEHVWYDPASVDAVIDEIEARLAALVPDRAADLTANADALRAEVEEITGQLEEIGAAHAGEQVVLTEPLAVYLIEAAGLVDATPGEFSEAVEEESDPPAAAIAEIDGLLTGGQVAAMVYNPQTETPVIEQVRTTADGASVPVVEMTETLPEGTGYAEWMKAQVQDLADALDR